MRKNCLRLVNFTIMVCLAALASVSTASIPGQLKPTDNFYNLDNPGGSESELFPCLPPAPLTENGVTATVVIMAAINGSGPFEYDEAMTAEVLITGVVAPYSGYYTVDLDGDLPNFGGIMGVSGEYGRHAQVNERFYCSFTMTDMPV